MPAASPTATPPAASCVRGRAGRSADVGKQRCAGELACVHGRRSPSSQHACPPSHALAHPGNLGSQQRHHSERRGRGGSAPAAVIPSQLLHQAVEQLKQDDACSAGQEAMTVRSAMAAS